MKNVVAVIAEDEPHLALALKDALARTWPALRIADVVGNGPAALLAVDRHAPDVLFLDIRMPGLTGLQVAERVSTVRVKQTTDDGGESVTHDPLIVFVTAYNEYAVQAFDREAVDYLVKPVDDARLAETVQRIKKRLAASHGGAGDGKNGSGGDGGHDDDDDANPARSELSRALALIRNLSSTAATKNYLQFLRAGIGETVRIVPVDDVTHLQAHDKYVSIYTRDGEQLIRISLLELATQLDPALFVQVHRSTIVNMRAVATASRDFSGKLTLTLHGVTQKIPVSRQYAHLFARM
jgi:DNA-binding LytR/AlgR family response regulator